MNQRMQKTSLDAFDDVKPQRPSIRSQIVDQLAFNQMTGEELEHALGIPHKTVSGRLTELRDDGVIIDSGARRATASGNKAIVWRLSVAMADLDVAGKRKCIHCGRYIRKDSQTCSRRHDQGAPLGTYTWRKISVDDPPEGVPLLAMTANHNRLAYAICYLHGKFYKVASGSECEHATNGWAFTHAFEAIINDVAHWRLFPK